MQSQQSSYLLDTLCFCCHNSCQRALAPWIQVKYMIEKKNTKSTCCSMLYWTAAGWRWAEFSGDLIWSDKGRYVDQIGWIGLQQGGNSGIGLLRKCRQRWSTFKDIISCTFSFLTFSWRTFWRRNVALCLEFWSSMRRSLTDNYQRCLLVCIRLGSAFSWDDDPALDDKVLGYKLPHANVLKWPKPKI